MKDPQKKCYAASIYNYFSVGWKHSKQCNKYANEERICYGQVSFGIYGPNTTFKKTNEFLFLKKKRINFYYYYFYIENFVLVFILKQNFSQHPSRHAKK